MELNTKRLRIIPLSEEEFALLLKGVDKMEKRLGLNESKETLDDHTKEAMVNLYEMLKENEENYIWYTNWQIILKEANMSIGSACFIGAPEDGKVEVGYGINERYRNNGYMTEAVISMRDWALSREDVRIFTAETEKDNTASHKVLKKSGLEKYKETADSFFWRVQR